MVLHIDRLFDIMVWILAILKVGACYVVLDKSLPLARKQAIFRVAEAKFFVTDLIDEAFFEQSASAPGTLNVWDKTDFPVGQPQPVTDAEPTDLAYIIFTSGSTGTPKAIMVEHQNLSSYVSSTRQVVKIGPGSRVLQFATFAFDASILEWAVTLSYGATMCFVNHPALLVGVYLADMIDLNRVNFFHTTPSVLSTLPESRKLPSLRMVSVGGEASSAGLLDKWSKKLKLIHSYGPTETTVICATENMVPKSEGLPSQSNIGLANPNTAIMICPEDSEQSLEQGQVGEICIVGPQVTRGYKGQPELTEEKFREIVFNGKTTRMYRSGDRGHLDNEGKLHILGRLSNREVKLRGYRLDLAAIEKSILEHCPEVMMASVQVVKESLVGFVTPDTVQYSLVRERISKDLPSYSLPSQLTAVNELPLNANGKVDHSQVPKQLCSEISDINETVVETKKSVRPRVSAGPSGAANREVLHTARIEASIAALWQGVLGLQEVPGLDTAFYDAGGHSILLTTLHKKIAAQYPESGISLLDVFYNPTVRRQAAHLAQLVTVSSSASSVVSEDFVKTPSTRKSRSSRNSVTTASTMGEDLFAIVGMAGRFPGADSVGEMWDLLMSQRDGITTGDGSKAQDAELTEGEIFVPRYGSINGLEDFRGSDWAMSEEEAKNLDPQVSVSEKGEFGVWLSRETLTNDEFIETYVLDCCETSS